MNEKIIYWLIIGSLGIIHIHMLLSFLPISIPVYITAIIGIALFFFLSRNVLVRVHSIGRNWNIVFYILQVFLLLFYIVESDWISNILPVILYIGLEVIRHGLGTKLEITNQMLQSLQEEQQHMNETFRIVRSERHDFLKHISTIHFMLEQNNASEAKKYLDDLVDQYEETNLSIKGERGTVAGILHHMYRDAKKAGIDIVYDNDVPISTLPIADQDLVALLGNLLSNSIDACNEWQKVRTEKPHISLQFYKRSGLYLLTCKNTSLPIPSNILDELFHTFGKTTKGEGHEGLGTKIISDIVKSYQGYLDFIYKKEEFTVKIKIPAIHDS